MSQVKYIEEEVIIKKAINALIKELGQVEAMRFINIPRKKRIESVKRHHEWQIFLDKGQFLDEIFGITINIWDVVTYVAFRLDK